jgi:hypothetical protein
MLSMNWYECIRSKKQKRRMSRAQEMDVKSTRSGCQENQRQMSKEQETDVKSAREKTWVLLGIILAPWQPAAAVQAPAMAIHRKHR